MVPNPSTKVVVVGGAVLDIQVQDMCSCFDSATYLQPCTTFSNYFGRRPVLVLVMYNEVAQCQARYATAAANRT